VFVASSGLLLSTLSANQALAAAPKPGSIVGQQAPDFTLPATNAKGQLALSGLRGKWCVLYFYPADFSSGCTLEASRFQRELERFSELDAKVVGVSVDDLDRHRDFCGKQGITFDLLSDTDGKTSFAYGTLLTSELGSFAQRQTFLIDPKGKVAYAWEKVVPGEHVDSVLAKLEELQKNKKRG